MREVRLETRGGELVHIGTIPPYRTLPEIALWGLRSFVGIGVNSSALLTDEENRPIYREAAVAVVDQLSPLMPPLGSDLAPEKIAALVGGLDEHPSDRPSNVDWLDVVTTTFQQQQVFEAPDRETFLQRYRTTYEVLRMAGWDGRLCFPWQHPFTQHLRQIKGIPPVQLQWDTVGELDAARRNVHQKIGEFQTQLGNRWDGVKTITCERKDPLTGAKELHVYPDYTVQQAADMLTLLFCLKEQLTTLIGDRRRAGEPLR